MCALQDVEPRLCYKERIKQHKKDLIKSVSMQ